VRINILVVRINIYTTLLLILISCGTSRIEGPAESYLPAEIPSVASELPVTIELDIRKLEQTVNSNLKGLLFQEDNISGKDLSVKVWKAADFSFFVYNNEITYKIPLKVWSKFGWSAKTLGLNLGDTYQTEGVISLVYKTSVSIDKNWKLVPKTVSGGYEWIEKPSVKAAGVSIPLTPIVSVLLSGFQGKINEQIDKAISQQINLREYVDIAWRELQNPLMLDSSNSVWLKIDPMALMLNPFETKGNKLRITLSLSGIVESYVGAFPPEREPVPLPEFKVAESAPGQFNLNISTDITYDKMTEIVRKELLGVNFHEEGKVYRIEEISMYSSHGRAVLTLQLNGTYRGKIFMTGIIVHNPVTNSLEITEADFDIRTKNTLIGTAKWLLHGKILKRITPLLRYPLEEDLTYLKEQANQMLQGYEIFPSLCVAGNLDRLEVKEVKMIPGAVRLMANLQGNLRVEYR